jgi:hypothetical protein
MASSPFSLLSLFSSLLPCSDPVCYQASDLESQMVAVERLESYSSMEQEAPHHLPNSDPDRRAGWPREGVLVMKDVCMRYRLVCREEGGGRWK